MKIDRFGFTGLFNPAIFELEELETEKKQKNRNVSVLDLKDIRQAFFKVAPKIISVGDTIYIPEFSPKESYIEITIEKISIEFDETFAETAEINLDNYKHPKAINIERLRFLEPFITVLIEGLNNNSTVYCTGEEILLAKKCPE